MDSNLGNDLGNSIKIGDRATSDVVVRLRTEEGRDDWLYCHSNILLEKSTFFAERLSDKWPTCQILDSRNCVEVYCHEADFNYHVTVLRLLYVFTNSSKPETLHNVWNALGILRVSVDLGCQQMIHTCVQYLEAVPWEETEEEEILKVIPRLGAQAEKILARLRPVNPAAILRIFLSAFRFATSSPPPSMTDLKSSAQEQLEYMLTEDDDAPLITSNDEIKTLVKEHVGNLLNKFYVTLDSFTCMEDELQLLHSLLSDLLWACQILAKIDALRDFVLSWLEKSDRIMMVVGGTTPSPEMLDIMSKVIEVAAKVIEAVAYGTVILPAAQRLQMVKSWVPFVRVTKPLVEGYFEVKNEDSSPCKIENDLWQGLESAIVSIVLALPSGDQADIISDWLRHKHIHYPDLTEAFEVLCYRSKVAKRKLESVGLGNE